MDPKINQWTLSLLILLHLVMSGCFDFSDTVSAAVVGGDGVDGVCPPAQDAIGMGVGDVIQDWTFFDAELEKHNLYDLCGDVVLVGVGAGWCTACREEMDEFIRWESELEGFSIFYALTQNNIGNPVSSQFLATWVADYGTTFPVLADPSERIWKTYAPGSEFPISILLNRQMGIELVGGNIPPEQLKQEIDRILARD